jgi:dTDP-4-dehydrorhamnose 3,5-epimerase
METPFLIHNNVFLDNRGIFAPLSLIYNDTDLNKKWIQSNISVNPKKHTLRGLHYQKEPFAQSKLVKVVCGKIIDFVLDIRPQSEQYGKLYVFELLPNDELYVPKGFAHGFITCENNTVVQYLVDEEYSKISEESILWSSIPSLSDKLFYFLPYLDIDNLIMSDKDKQGTNWSYNK